MNHVKCLDLKHKDAFKQFKDDICSKMVGPFNVFIIMGASVCLYYIFILYIII